MNKKEIHILKQGLLYAWNLKMINDSKEFQRLYRKLTKIEIDMENKMRRK